MGALLAFSFVGCSGEQFVDEIVIENPTAFAPNVDVTGDARNGWLSLATAESHSEKAIEDVLDQGPTWVFRFRYSGYEQELRVARAELADSGWRVQVPSDFASALEQRGIAPPP